jgi:hypothetical protein
LVAVISAPLHRFPYLRHRASQFGGAKISALAPDRETREKIKTFFAPARTIPVRIVDCNQSVALLSRSSGISRSAIVMQLARSHDDNSCLLPFCAATGTPFLRAEEFMPNERVIAHSMGRTLSLRHDIARFFICCLLHEIDFAAVSHIAEM